MKREHIKNMTDGVFRRVIAVKRQTFRTMIEILEKAEAIKKSKGGRPSKLTLEDKLLMTLEYLREYRTYAAIAATY